MKVTFLGTGTSQGIPLIGCQCEVCNSQDIRDKRLRSSIHVFDKNTSIIVDTGPDFRYQILRSRIHKLSAILLTHEHNDHIAGLDDIRPFNFMSKSSLKVYGMERTLSEISKRFEYVFYNNAYPGSPKVSKCLVSEDFFYISDLKIEPLEINHGNLPILGYKFGKLAYLTDVSYIPPFTQEKLYGLEVLIISALRKDPHHSHFTLSESLAMIRELRPKRAYLTHISHYSKHEDLEEELPNHVYVAFDGMTLHI